uniref:Secreted peptide n=1 Tax=Anopheles braziliensis TaxID=58242 RepID=A0A2M3ZLA4_9DIPT
MSSSLSLPLSFSLSFSLSLSLSSSHFHWPLSQDQVTEPMKAGTKEINRKPHSTHTNDKTHIHKQTHTHKDETSRYGAKRLISSLLVSKRETK